MTIKRAVLLSFFLIFAASFSYAGGVQFGIQVDYNKFKDTEGGDPGVGARMVFGDRFSFIGSFDYYFIDDNLNSNVKFYEFNGNLAFSLSVEAVEPYFGGGVNFSRVSFDDDVFGNSADSEIGINLLGGVKFETGSVQPFGEFRYVLFPKGDERIDEDEGDFNDRYVFSAGVLF